MQELKSFYERTIYPVDKCDNYSIFKGQLYSCDEYLEYELIPSPYPVSDFYKVGSVLYVLVKRIAYYNIEIGGPWLPLKLNDVISIGSDIKDESLLLHTKGGEVFVCKKGEATASFLRFEVSSVKADLQFTPLSGENMTFMPDELYLNGAGDLYYLIKKAMTLVPLPFVVTEGCMHTEMVLSYFLISESNDLYYTWEDFKENCKMNVPFKSVHISSYDKGCRFVVLTTDKTYYNLYRDDDFIWVNELIV